MPASIDFSLLAKRVFEDKNGVLSIGGEVLKTEMRELLREQARYLKTSQLWEIMHATALQEAADLALVQSKDWEHVQVAKMLKHWDYIFENMIYQLSKD